MINHKHLSFEQLLHCKLVVQFADEKILKRVDIQQSYRQNG